MEHMALYLNTYSGMLQFLTALLSLSMTVYIYHRQVAEKRENIKLNLFDKRYALYKKFYYDILSVSVVKMNGPEKSAGDDAIQEYLYELKEALNKIAYYEDQFLYLYGKDTYAFVHHIEKSLNKIYDKIRDGEICENEIKELKKKMIDRDNIFTKYFINGDIHKTSSSKESIANKKQKS